MRAAYKRSYYWPDSSAVSATEIVPVIMALVKPSSVVDLGCALGGWLRVFKDNGVKEILGVDGDWIDQELLLIAREEFITADLTKPLDVRKRFDLAISLEVAEHIESQYADVFLDSLTKLSSVVLFTAAVPDQGGVHHVNEQWPEYWVDKFKKRGFILIDCVRKKIWESNVEPCYAQNSLLFVEPNELKNHPNLQGEMQGAVSTPLSLVHPRMFLSHTSPETIPLRVVLRAMKKAPTRLVRRYLNRRRPI